MATEDKDDTSVLNQTAKNLAIGRNIVEEYR